MPIPKFKPNEQNENPKKWKEITNSNVGNTKGNNNPQTPMDIIKKNKEKGH